MFLMGYISSGYGINIAFRIYTSFQINIFLSAEVPRCGDLFFLSITSFLPPPLVFANGILNPFPHTSLPPLDLSSARRLIPSDFEKIIYVPLLRSCSVVNWDCGSWDTRCGVGGVVSGNDKSSINRRAS
jgi:hypothetical protein